MKPNYGDEFVVDSDVTGKRVTLSIDPAATAHIMRAMTRLYSNPEEAVVREYCTNAWDSHVEAGVTRPIEVTLPTAIAPFLTIQDFGIGLSSDEIENIYALYGASTKRETNEQTGSLGFGCKSALAYTAHFTMIAVKDGQKVNVSIGRDSHGAGEITIKDPIPTDEHNGVTIIVPSTNYSSMERTAKNFFRFWPDGRVLLNGEEPAKLKGTPIADNMIVTPELNGQSYIVMGGVPYPVEESLFKLDLKNEYSLVATVPIGDITFAPSREAVERSELTLATIAKIRDEFKVKSMKAIQSQINKAKSHAEAMQIAVNMRFAFGAKDADFVYKRVTIPKMFKAPDNSKFIVSDRKEYVKSRHSRQHEVYAGTMIKSLIVYDYSNQFHASHKSKLNKYCDDNGLSYDKYILCLTKPDDRWLNPEQIVPWEEIRKVKLPWQRQSNGRTKNIPGSYDCFVSQGQQYDHHEELAGNDIDQTKPIYYVRKYDFGMNSKLIAAIRIMQQYKKKGFTVVVLGENRVAKFKRLFPKCATLDAALGKIYEREAKKVKQEDLLAYWVRNREYGANKLAGLDPAQIKDPWLKDAVRMISAPDNDFSTVHLAPFNPIVSYLPSKNLLKMNDPGWKNPIDKYALFDGIRYNHKKHPHTYLYLNAAYEASKVE